MDDSTGQAGLVIVLAGIFLPTLVAGTAKGRSGQALLIFLGNILVFPLGLAGAILWVILLVLAFAVQNGAKRDRQFAKMVQLMERR